ncbi:MAG: sigma-70 family RNA polymerase sigma factor [Candidatus Pacebacteria bacterium]|nr:sigma-70 family RNA polymerase sigma factor [Candidatus Paceibacterota bacterium]
MRLIKELSDESIVEQVRSFDQELYVVLVERYQHKLLRYAQNLIHNEHKAADVVQESFIKAFINLQGFDTKKKFSSWIYRIVHNEAMNSIKKYQKEVQMPEGFDFASSEDIEANFERKEEIASVQTHLKKLPVIYAEPLALRYLEDKTYEEISDILRLPMGTVATRIKRAKALMKHICQSH